MNTHIDTLYVLYIINQLYIICLLGALGPEEAKARWKYLRDNYAKARKKAKAYIPSGSAAKAGGLNKSKFRFYDLP